jgi:glycosyltransferase involved in cell wall biosynthesis
VKLIGVFNRDIPFVNLYKPEKEINDPIVVEFFSYLLDKIKPDFIHFQNFLGLSFGIAEVAYNKGYYSTYIPYNYHLIDPNLYMIESNLDKWDSVDKYKNSNLFKDNPELINGYKKRDEAALNLLNKWVTNVQAVSSRVKEILVEFGVNKDKIVVINQISQFTTKLNNIYSEINNPLRFGFIGGIMPHKGVHNIIAASAGLKANSCEIMLYGFVNDSYKELLQSINTKVKVNFMGKYDSKDMEEISKNIDVAILPSIWEDCGPHVISECLAMGLPVIAPNIGGFSDYIDDGLNGFIYKYDDINSLLSIMDKLINDNKILNNIIANAKLAYSYNDYLDIIKKYYQEKPELKYINNYETIFKNKLNLIDFAKTEAPIQAMNRDTGELNLSVGFSNNKAKGKLPEVLPSPLRLNLGCGNDFREGFLNVDLFSDNPNVVYMDVRNLSFNDNSVDLILASDILEHFSHREIPKILKEWARVLKENGTLIIRCPNIRLQIDAYIRGDWDADIASYMIFGGQTNPGDYHAVGFDEKSIKKHLENVGLNVELIENEDFPQNNGFINLNMTVKARKGNIKLDQYENIKSKFEENQKEFKKNTKKEEKPKVVPDDLELNIVWEGSQFVTHSLALINREICYNIIKANNSNLSIVPYEDDRLNPDQDPKLSLLKEYDVRFKEQVDEAVADLPYVWIRHQWPPKEEPPIGAKWIIMQPWEYTAHRKDFLEIFHQAEEIWTPSNYSRKTFIDSGIEPNKVQIIPNGIDPEVFKPNGNKYNLKTKKKLKLLFIGGSIMRKGIDILLNVYFNIFERSDDVCLVIKDFGSDTFYQGQNISDKLKEYQNNINLPEIELINENLTQDEMVSLYRSCDVFISPYRGEGFCLPALEAMACGLPVVVTEGGATDDFVDESCGWLVPAEYQAIGDNLNGKETQGEVGWLLPDQKVLGFIMKEISVNPSKLFSMGLIGSFRARKYWTWRNSTLKVFSRIDALYGTKLANKALKNLPEFNDDWLELSRAEELFAEYYFDESEKLFKELISRDIPDEIKQYACNVIILINLENNNLNNAKKYLENAKLINEKNIDTLYLESKYYALNEDYEKALEILNPVVENWIENKWYSKMGLTLDDLIAYMGDVIFDMNDIESALKMYDSALEHNPTNLNARFGAGMCFKENGEIGRAVEMFEETLRINENYLPSLEQLEELKVEEN